MIENDIKLSCLEIWLRKKRMSTKDFAEKIGCSRQVIWKVKKNKAICPNFAKKIIEITDGFVEPLIEPVGGRR